MGCCASNLKLKELNLNSSIYLAADGSGSGSGKRSLKRLYSSRNSSGVGSSSSSSKNSSSRSIWSRSSQPICDDFAEQPQLDRSCGYYTCSSANSSPRKQQEDGDEEEEEVLMRTQDMSEASQSRNSTESHPMAGNLEWEMYMMQQAQRIMPKTSSPISQRRGNGHIPASSYQKWRNYLQSTPAHMLHNVTHIPEAIAGHFCPTGFPGFSDLEEMESAAKRFKVDLAEEPLEEPLYTTYQLLAGYTHTISTDL
nr:uncharacterized protein LOC108016992 [Drosophila suzukii]